MNDRTRHDLTANMTQVENSLLQRIKMAIVFERKCLFLLCILASITRCQTQTCSSVLNNFVFYEGTSLTLSPVNDTQVAIVSSSDFSNVQRIIMNYDGVVVSQFSTTYKVSTPGNITFNSTVAPQGSSPYATAGLYIITSIHVNQSCANGLNLIIISRNGSVCSYNESDPNNVKLLCTCSVDFAETSVMSNYPVFTWKNGTSVVKQQQPIPSQISSFLNRSTSEFVIGGNDTTIYECQLTFNSTPNATMNYVSRTDPTFTMSWFSPKVVYMTPTFGPAAGGTVVTIVAKWMALENVSISAVYIGQNLQATITRSTKENVLATTTAFGTELEINQQLPISLKISPSTNFSTGKTFTYKPNPRINDIVPKELPVSGGTNLTISGTSLDSAAQPLVRAEVVIRRGSVITYNNQSFSSCFQPTQNGTQMICLSPPIYIRDDFLQQLFGQVKAYNSSRKKRETIFSYGWTREDRTELNDAALHPIRTKRSAPIFTNQTYALRDSEDKLVIYVGIIFDGYKRYENNSLVDSGRSFSVCILPTLKCKDHIAFDDNTITIQGDNLTNCYRQSDYSVRIGDGSCRVKNLTDNELTCYPPEKKPQQTENDINNCGKDFAVMVEVGFKNYSCSCLKYPNDDTTTLIIIIVATVGSFVVVLVIIAVIVVVVKRAKKAKVEASHPEFREYRHGENSYAKRDHQLQNDKRSTPVQHPSSVMYSKHIDTIYFDSTSERSYTNQMPGSSFEPANRNLDDPGYSKAIFG